MGDLTMKPTIERDRTACRSRFVRGRGYVRLNVEHLEDRTLLSGGALDPTFGNGGVATSFHSSTYEIDAATTLALQPDGRILVVGRLPGPTNVLERLNPDGSVDTQFGMNGIVALNEYDPSVTVQPDGKIIVAGSTGYFGGILGERSIDVARLNRDGSLDYSFGPTGSGREVVTGQGEGMHANALTLQSDGSIVVVGRLGTYSQRFLAIRLTKDGLLDPSFGQSGLAVGVTGEANAVALQANGDIVLAGSKFNWPNTVVAVERLLPDGTLDGGFSVDDPFHGSGVSSTAKGVAIQADGKILVSGTSIKLDGSTSLLAARFLTDGTLDSSFAEGGIGQFSFAALDPITGSAAGGSIQIRANGQIVLLCSLGSAVVPVMHGVGAVQLNADGSLDPDFGTDGETVLRFLDHDGPTAVGLLQPDGKLLTAGYSFDSSYHSQFTVVRLTGDVGPLRFVTEILTPPMIYQPNPTDNRPSFINEADTSSPSPTPAPLEAPAAAQKPVVANTPVANQTAGLVLLSSAATGPVPIQASQPPSPAPVPVVLNIAITRPAGSGTVLAYPAGGGTGSLSGDESSTNVPTSTLLPASDLSVLLVAPFAPLSQASDSVWLDAFFSGDWVLPPALDVFSASPALVQSLAESGRVVGDSGASDAAESSASSLAVALVLLGSTLTVSPRSGSERPTIASR
jgi:uncharacterized delta-60 repeat protein